MSHLSRRPLLDRLANQESAQRVLFQEIALMEAGGHSDERATFGTNASPAGASITEQQWSHSKGAVFSHWARGWEERGVLWASNIRESSSNWGWVTLGLLISTFVWIALLLIICYAFDDSDRLLQRKRQEDIGFSYSAAVSSQLMLLMSNTVTLNGLVQGSMVFLEGTQTGLESLNGAPLFHFRKHAMRAVDRVRGDSPTTYWDAPTVSMVAVPQGYPTEGYPSDAVGLGYDLFNSSWKGVMIYTALRGIMGVSFVQLDGIEYIVSVIPIFNNSLPQSEKDARNVIWSSFDQLSHRDVISRYGNLSFSALRGIVPGMWGWVGGFMQSRSFVNATGLSDNLNATGGLDMSWCLYTVDPVAYGGQMFVFGSNNAEKASSGYTANITSYFTAGGGQELDPRPAAYCTELLNSPETTVINIPTSRHDFHTLSPWTLLIRSNHYRRYLTVDNMALFIMLPFSVCSTVVGVVYCVVACRRRDGGDSAAPFAPKTTPFAFMTVRLVEGEMLWQTCPEAAFDLVEKFREIVRCVARENDLYECPLDAPHVFGLASRRVLPAVEAAEAILVRISHLRYPPEVSSRLFAADDKSLRRAAEQQLLHERMMAKIPASRRSSCQQGPAVASSSLPANLGNADTVVDAAERRPRHQGHHHLLRGRRQMRPFLVQIIIQRCDDGAVLFDLHTNTFRYSPSYSHTTVSQWLSVPPSHEPICVPNCIYLTEPAAKEIAKTAARIALKPCEPPSWWPSSGASENNSFSTSASMAMQSATSLGPRLFPIMNSPLASSAFPKLYIFTRLPPNDTLSISAERAVGLAAAARSRYDSYCVSIADAYRLSKATWDGILGGTGDIPRRPKNEARGRQHRQRKHAAETPNTTDESTSASPIGDTCGSTTSGKNGDDSDGSKGETNWGVSGTRSKQDASRDLVVPPAVDAALRAAFEAYVPNFLEALQRSNDHTRNWFETTIAAQTSAPPTAGSSQFTSPTNVTPGGGVTLPPAKAQLIDDVGVSSELSQSLASLPPSSGDTHPDALYAIFRIRLFVYVNALTLMLSAFHLEEKERLLQRLQGSFQGEGVTSETVMYHLAIACCLANDLANLPLIASRMPKDPDEDS